MSSQGKWVIMEIIIRDKNCNESRCSSKVLSLISVVGSSFALLCVLPLLDQSPVEGRANPLKSSANSSSIHSELQACKPPESESLLTVDFPPFRLLPFDLLLTQERLLHLRTFLQTKVSCVFFNSSTVVKDYLFSLSCCDPSPRQQQNTKTTQILQRVSPIHVSSLTTTSSLPCTFRICRTRSIAGLFGLDAWLHNFLRVNSIHPSNRPNSPSPNLSSSTTRWPRIRPFLISKGISR
jgi:hypothetical protein